MSNSNKILKCIKCNKVFETKLELDKHGWAYHPSNRYEKFWSKCYHSGKWPEIGGSYFKDNPYY
jgi:hypothetical protein